MSKNNFSSKSSTESAPAVDSFLYLSYNDYKMQQKVKNRIKMYRHDNEDEDEDEDDDEIDDSSFDSANEIMKFNSERFSD